MRASSAESVVELLELAPEQLGARQHVLDRGPEQVGRSIVALLERIAKLSGCVSLTMWLPPSELLNWSFQ